MKHIIFIALVFSLFGYLMYVGFVVAPPPPNLTGDIDSIEEMIIIENINKYSIFNHSKI